MVTKSKLISDMNREDRPREKALRDGFAALSDAELMALIFSTGIKGKNVIELCQEIIDDNHGHLSPIMEMSPQEFIDRYKGIGPAKALTFLAALQIGARATADRYSCTPMSDSSIAHQYMKRRFYNLDHEQFWALMLKQNNTVIKDVRIGQGGLTATLVDIRVLMREAITCRAVSIILFHNHPSGNLKASISDINLTKKIAEACKTLDIRLLDHIIVHNDTFYSFSDNGDMP